MAHAQGLLDILYQRNATFEDRQRVSNELKLQTSNKPLEVTDAIAELCYGVDLCAQLTPEPNNCEDIDPNDEDAVSEMSEECEAKFFRKVYGCSENVEKQSLSQIKVSKNMLSDINKLYGTLVEDHMISAFSRHYNVDFLKLAKDPKAMKEFERKYPHAMEHIKVVMGENLGMGAYTMECYSKLNSLLYSNNQQSLQRYFNFYKAVINTMALYPEHKKMVNRGANLPKSVLKEHHKVGNIVCYQGFTSTAVHDPERDFGSNPANSFLSGKCTQRLYISYNDSAEGGKLISNASAFKHEDEVLFEPGSCFRIDKVYPRTDEAPEGEEDDVDCEEGQRYNFEMTLVK